MNTKCHCTKCDPIISFEVLRIHKRLNEAIAELQLQIIHVESLAQASALEDKVLTLTKQLQYLGRTEKPTCQDPNFTLQ